MCPYIFAAAGAVSGPVLSAAVGFTAAADAPHPADTADVICDAASESAADTADVICDAASESAADCLQPRVWPTSCHGKLTDRQTHRQTDRQTDRQTGRQTD